jgi:uncharacterized protein DUF2877
VLGCVAVQRGGIPVTDVGWKARRLVAAAVGAPVVVTRLSRSIYLDVGGEIVWLGPPGSTLHGRAIITEAPESAARIDPMVGLDLSAAREWAPAALPTGVSGAAMAGAAAELARLVPRLGRPEGFGALLTGAPLPFPLNHAARDATALVAACGAGDAGAAATLGERLLGLGPGLTPAGDDLVGGAFFARRVLADVGAVDPASWRQAVAVLHACARERTHRISAALLGDLLDGAAYAPLHDLAAALAAGDTTTAALAAATRLLAIGHSSGWDILTGFLTALRGTAPA